MNDDRYTKGWEKLKEIDGETGQHVIDSLKRILASSRARSGHQ